MSTRLIIPVDDTGAVSDGHHTFDELYEHRHLLFIALCHWIKEAGIGPKLWRSGLHSDGSRYEGWFVAGIGSKNGEQVTYHLPDRLWDDLKCSEILERAPEWDGHDSGEVLNRLRRFFIE